jgi:hypothetical protein
MDKYQNAKNLIKQITESFLSNDEIIDCETILRKRSEWFLNENEFNAKQEFNFFGNNTNNKSFLYFVNAVLMNKILLLNL